MSKEDLLFSDIVDIDTLNEIFKRFCEVTGATIGLVEHRTNKIITKAGWRDICSKFHRQHPISLKNCIASNKALTANLSYPGQINIKVCNNGLVDGATPIFIGGMHLANLYSGQVFFNKPDEAFFLELAEKYSFDKESYLEAVRQVPVIMEDYFRNILSYLASLATIIGTIGLHRLQIETTGKKLSKEIEDRKRIERELLVIKENLEKEVEARTSELKLANDALMEEIAQHKKSREALEKQVHFLHELMDAIPLPIFFKDVNGVYMGCNKAFEKAKGMPRDQIIGRTVGDISPFEVAEICNTADRVVLKKGDVHKYENKVLLADGKVHHIQFYKAPFFEPDGRLGGLVGTVIDITSQKDTEEKLRSIKTLLEKTFESLDVAIFVTETENNTILACNRAAEEIFGYRAEELVGKKAEILQTSHQDYLKFVKRARAALNSSSIFKTERLMKRKDGSAFHCEHTVSYILDDEKKPFALVCLIRDLTAQKEAEKRANVLKKRNDLILTSAGEGIMGLDRDGNITFVNPAAQKILGYSEEELIGKNTHPLLHHHRPDKTPYPEEECPIYASFRDGKIYRMEEDVFWHKDKTPIHVQYTSTPIWEDGRLSGAVVTFQDITERKREEQERESLREQLQQAQKMQAIGQLAGGVAHDFNNLLTAICGNADLASLKLTKDNPVQRHIQEIQKVADRATSLTRQLLALSRKQPLKPKIVEVNSLIQNMEKMLSRLIGEDIEIMTNLQASLPKIKADPGQIEQIILNLVVNARDAMPYGGTIQVTTQSVYIDQEGDRNHQFGKKGTFVKLTVKDSGIGMDQRIIDHIFEPFFTTKGQGYGTGLGLSVVLGVVEQHGGWIKVDSEPGKGSTFTIYLPADENYVANLDDISENMLASMVQGSKETILLVEDDEYVRKFAVSILKESNYTVFDASCLQEALNIFEKHRDDIMLLFSDVILPDGNGVDLCQTILDQRPDILILLTSGYTGERSLWNKIVEKGFCFLEKPYNGQTLLNKIKELLIR